MPEETLAVTVEMGGSVVVVAVTLSGRSLARRLKRQGIQELIVFSFFKLLPISSGFLYSFKPLTLKLCDKERINE